MSENTIELAPIFSGDTLPLSPIEEAERDLFEIQSLKLHTIDRSFGVSDSIERGVQHKLVHWLGVLIERKIEDLEYLVHRDLGEMQAQTEMEDFMRRFKNRERMYVQIGGDNE